MTCCPFIANYRASWCERMFLKTHNKPSFVTVMWGCSFVFRFPHPVLTARHSFNFQSSIVQPVSNSWHFCKCQSSTEDACFCSTKWERIPAALGWWTFALRNGGLLCCCLFFFLQYACWHPFKSLPVWQKQPVLCTGHPLQRLHILVLLGSVEPMIPITVLQ